ncbi:MAG: hypothetical protein L6N94_05565 [Candidatus Methylarchaceae archaeon HK01M]|nr:hypothetical protein [Candidatus Methylarchaceae archaeon HK01M]
MNSSLSPNKKVVANGREFYIQVLRVKNGCFLIISEGEEIKLGSMALSVKVGDRANSTSIFPSRFGDIYSRVFAEFTSMIVKGIAVVSLYILTPIDSQIVKKLLNEVKEILKSIGPIKQDNL